MVSNEYQDLKKPELFSSPTVAGLVVSNRLRKTCLDQMAERAVRYVKGTAYYALRCEQPVLSLHLGSSEGAGMAATPDE